MKNFVCNIFSNNGRFSRRSAIAIAISFGLGLLGGPFSNEVVSNAITEVIVEAVTDSSSYDKEVSNEETN